MNICQDVVNGIPAVGLGTAGLVEAEILAGIHAGARHLDCARMYGNEKAVGSAIRKSRVQREELFITSKIFNDEHSGHDAEAAVRSSLQDMQLSYLDLVLIHWPCSWCKGRPFVTDPRISIVRDTWPVLSRLHDEGLIKKLGVSNFDQAQLQVLLTQRVPCQVNQIEAHPFYQNTQLIEFCQRHKIQCIAWGPLSKGRNSIRNDARLFTVARMLNCTPYEVALRWNLDRGVLVIPKSTNRNHLQHNLKTVHMKPLSEHDHRLIEQCETGKRRFPDLIGVWPSTSHPLASYIIKPLLALLVKSFVFLFGPLDIVAIAQRQARRRELRYLKKNQAS